ncbi:MAG: hypothetical protein LAT68_12705 [Cyclobacteriaceae bacterium]|nr:hypothetical protein [Cyclobacteriaceae bacterium]MCH8517179.1 hypothetical protein [Cyclobacteriaceae bacterium]
MKYTQILNYKDFSFPIKHENKRKYRFTENWEVVRIKLEELIKNELTLELKEEVKDVEIYSSYPLRKSRLGNFYLHTEGKVILTHQKEIDLQKTGCAQLFIERYENLDQEEAELRKSIETQHSLKQYEVELELRVQSLSYFYRDKTMNQLQSLAKQMLANEGWTPNRDNRQYARIKRIKEPANESKEFLSK